MPTEPDAILTVPDDLWLFLAAGAGGGAAGAGDGAAAALLPDDVLLFFVDPEPAAAAPTRRASYPSRSRSGRVPTRRRTPRLQPGRSRVASYPVELPRLDPAFLRPSQGAAVSDRARTRDWPEGYVE